MLAAPTHLSLAKGAAQVELVTQAMWPALTHFFLVKTVFLDFLLRGIILYCSFQHRVNNDIQAELRFVDWWSCKICASCVDFSGEQHVEEQNLHTPNVILL